MHTSFCESYRDGACTCARTDSVGSVLVPIDRDHFGYKPVECTGTRPCAHLPIWSRQTWTRYFYQRRFPLDAKRRLLVAH